MRLFIFGKKYLVENLFLIKKRIPSKNHIFLPKSKKKITLSMHKRQIFWEIKMYSLPQDCRESGNETRNLYFISQAFYLINHPPANNFNRILIAKVSLSCFDMQRNNPLNANTYCGCSTIRFTILRSHRTDIDSETNIGFLITIKYFSRMLLMFSYFLKHLI